MRFLNQISLSKDSSIAVYIQISNALANLIERGELPPGFKMPGTRSAAKQLSVHRKTAIQAYDELLSQGFIEVIPSKGTFVTKEIPRLTPKMLGEKGTSGIERAPFDFHRYEHLKKPFLTPSPLLTIDEGLPDLRLAPIREIRRTYNGLLSRTHNLKYLMYNSPAGNRELRNQLANYLQETRGLKVSEEQILITRGSQMGLYLAAQMILSAGDQVVVGSLNYQTANVTLIHAGAKLMTVPTDHQGVVTTAIEEVCKRTHIKAIYVTSHHHHPTTAHLSVERRMHLLSLSAQYGFVILEDDYDYDFHYERSPLMPLASADTMGHVIYMGGISKILAPGLRIGFLVGPRDFIQHVIYLRCIMDRQGDYVMEQVLAMLLASGDFQRHSKKALKTYLGRRDRFVRGLEELAPHVSFDTPSGGLAVWTKLRDDIPWAVLDERVLKKGLKIPNWKNYDPEATGHNFIRLGFASLNEAEMDQAFEILKEGIGEVPSVRK